MKERSKRWEENRGSKIHMNKGSREFMGGGIINGIKHGRERLDNVHWTGKEEYRDDLGREQVQKGGGYR